LRVAQLAQGLDLRISAGHLAERLIAFVERAVGIRWPRHTVPPHVVSPALFAPMRHAVFNFINSVGPILLQYEIDFDPIPV
jgi:hypothetical protein